MEWVNTDGTGQEVLTPSGGAGTFSPDGKSIAFVETTGYGLSVVTVATGPQVRSRWQAAGVRLPAFLSRRRGSCAVLDQQMLTALSPNLLNAARVPSPAIPSIGPV